MTDEELRSTVITLRRLLSCIITVLFETTSTRFRRVAFCGLFHPRCTRAQTDAAHAPIYESWLQQRPCAVYPTTPSTNTQCYTVTELIQGIALSFDPVVRPHEGKFLTAERYFPKQKRRQFNFFRFPLVLFLLSSLPFYMIYDYWEHIPEIKPNRIARNGQKDCVQKVFCKLNISFGSFLGQQFFILVRMMKRSFKIHYE